MQSCCFQGVLEDFDLAPTLRKLSVRRSVDCPGGGFKIVLQMIVDLRASPVIGRKDSTKCRLAFGTDLGAPTCQKPVFGLTSSIGDQAREAFVHVILMMAMEERVARIVGHEVDFRGGKARQAYGVLDDAGC